MQKFKTIQTKIKLIQVTDTAKSVGTEQNRKIKVQEQHNSQRTTKCARTRRLFEATVNYMHYLLEHQETLYLATRRVYIVTGDPWFETRSQRCSVVRQTKLRLAELITNLIEFERNVYWRMGRRLKFHTGGTDLKAVRHGQYVDIVRLWSYCCEEQCDQTG